MSISRRAMTRLLLAATALGATAVAACADGDTTGAGSATDAVSQPVSASDAAPTSSAVEAAFPVTLDHKYGQTVIDSEPQRVVSAGFSDQDTLLALGVIPVGIRDWYGDQPYAVWPWAQAALGDAEPEVLSSAELNYEAIAALDPDVIIGVYSGMTDEEYGLLSDIAPTVPQSGDFLDYGMPWRDGVRMVGMAVGRSAAADDLVAETEALFEQAREDHPEFEGRTAAVAFTFQDSPGAYASADPRAQIMADLGFVTPAEYDEIAGEAFYASFSGEQIGLLDTDVLVWIGGTDADIQAIRDLPLRQSLDAATQGREVFLDPTLSGAFSFASPLSIPFLLDTLVPELALAVDGDPATLVPPAS